MDEKVFWGELHTHTALSDGTGTAEQNFDIARSHLDFWAMADHAWDPVVFTGEGSRTAPWVNDRWGDIQRLCRDSEQPGRFVPLLAYEWTNFRYGHHNVYYLDYDEPIRMPPTLPELYAALRGIEAMVIPHHTGYPVGICGKDWSVHDEHLTPFVEIYSMHGSSEAPDGIVPLLTCGSWMGPGAPGGSVQEALARGYRLGLMASSDSHFGHPGVYDCGLIAARADELTRRGLWQAFRRRSIWGVTGDRIVLDFRIDGRPMGSVLRSAGPRRLEISAEAWDRIDRVDIVRNNALLRSFLDPRGAAPGRGRLRFLVEWGWDRRSARDWAASLDVRGGRITQAIPCYRGSAEARFGHGVQERSQGRCRWTSHTEEVVVGWLFRGYGDAMAFEVDCDDEAELRFEFACGDMRQAWSLSPRQIAHGAFVRYMPTIPVVEDGAYWGRMDSVAKVKVHRGSRTGDLSVDLAHVDEAGEPPAGAADVYYVRLLQKNGQRAWSSPIWVER